ncbi:MAG: peptidase domain-containing ABC transporter [Allosphingosinicella sp.]
MTSFLNLSGRRTLPVIRQAEAAECGLASVAMVAGYHGHEVDLATMRRRFGISLKGMTLRTIIDVAGEIGLGSRPLRCEPTELGRLQTPAILHWGTNHFVVLKKASGRRCHIHDPALGSMALPMEEVSKKFTGIAVEMAPNAAFKRAKERNPLKLGSLISLGGGVSRGLVQTLILTVLLEVLILAGPFYLQFVIDEAVLKGDAGLLAVLALAFGLLLLFRVLATVLRGLSVQFVSNALSFDMKGRIFNHLVRLPLDWFQKRQVGDIQSRFGAIAAIEMFVAQGALAGILDGLVGTLVLVFLFAYSPTLALIVLASIGLYVVLRATTFQLTKRFAADVIVNDAREQTRFLETLRAAQTLKSAGAENVRETQYRNSVAATVNSQIRAGNINIGYFGAEQLLNGITDILVIYLGARAILSGDLSLGMLTAFLAYKGQFVARFTNLVEQVFAWRLLDLQLERLSDIALAPKEERIDRGGFEGIVEGAVECRRLIFRYAFGESNVISGLNLTIRPGECIAIVGPSGCGKSTLAKLLTGLYTPTHGEVLIDGRPLAKWSNRSLRSQISYVSQEDQLLAGSIAENIAFFAEDISMEQVRASATLARVNDEIMAMPMGYESLVGDMGSSLSGGQKQRVLIARALYRRPKILVMDEGTAHLDVINEREVTAALSALPITRIVIAHRPETIAAADRVFDLSVGESTRISFPVVRPTSTAQPEAAPAP